MLPLDRADTFLEETEASSKERSFRMLMWPASPNELDYSIVNALVRGATFSRVEAAW